MTAARSRSNFIYFSEEITISYVNVRDDMLDVTGSEVTRARRLEQGSNLGWEITIEPESDADVSIVLSPMADCEVAGAACTADGRALSNGQTAIVPGPDPPEASEASGNEGGTPILTASTAAPLTEATLDGSEVLFTLSGGRAYGFEVYGGEVTVSGIEGATIHYIVRDSDTQLTVVLEFEGDFDTDATLTFTVTADAIADYNGSGFTGQIPVTAYTESIVASTEAPLTEATLDGSEVTLTLSGGRTYGFEVYGGEVTVSGIEGATIHYIVRDSDTQLTVVLEFEGDFDTDATLTFTVAADAIADYNGPPLTAQIPVTAVRENSLAANFPNPFNPETWISYQLAEPAEVTLTIYAVNGQVVRRLELGHQPTGTYAAYWDGRSEFGEPVASGVYFYTLTAGDFIATRKMLIQK